MAAKFTLTMVTPDGKKLVDDITILNVVTTAGALGILAHHQPLVAIIEISHLNYKKDNESYDFAIMGGILNVTQEGVLILADAFERKDEIDIDRANAAKERALELLNSKSEDVDEKRAKLALRRAMSRISLTK